MKKKFYSFWGVSQLLVGAMTIGLVSCEKSSELLYDFSETSESSIQSRAISVADSVSLFSKRNLILIILRQMNFIHQICMLLESFLLR